MPPEQIVLSAVPAEIGQKLAGTSDLAGPCVKGMMHEILAVQYSVDIACLLARRGQTWVCCPSKLVVDQR